MFSQTTRIGSSSLLNPARSSKQFRREMTSENSTRPISDDECDLPEEILSEGSPHQSPCTVEGLESNMGNSPLGRELDHEGRSVGGTSQIGRAPRAKLGRDETRPLKSPLQQDIDSLLKIMVKRREYMKPARSEE